MCIAGIIDWGPHTSALFTHFIAAFDVPVGSATSAHNTHRPAPAKALILHSSNVSEGLAQPLAQRAPCSLRLNLHLCVEPGSLLPPAAGLCCISCLSKLSGLAEVPRALLLLPAVENVGSLHPLINVCFWPQMGGIYQHVARLQVALLRTCPQRPHTRATAAAALPHLRQLAGLLDNYLHPSNTGALGS
jgi:hypothetical protein